MTTAAIIGALGVSPDLVAALSEQGTDEPFPIHSLTIADALAGRDVCGKAKTGSGKTLAFGLPLIERVQPASPRCPTGLVLVPTRELANQVFQVLEPLAARRGHRVAAVYGGVGFEGQLAALRAGVTIVVGTPGRLIDVLERGELRLSAVQVLVLDEADRMLDMGFLPQVQKILYRLRPDPQTMLFPATPAGPIRRPRDPALGHPRVHRAAADERTA